MKRLLFFVICHVLFVATKVSSEYADAGNSIIEGSNEETVHSNPDSMTLNTKSAIIQNESSTLDINETAVSDEYVAVPNFFSRFENSRIKSENNNGSNCTNSTFQVSCFQNRSYEGFSVEIVNGSRLMTILQVAPNITSRQTPANCVVVMFYSPSCPFSCMAAPHFNALPRAFPDVKMAAVDAMTYHSFNAQFGIVGVPTLMLFHNGRPAARFNETSEYALEIFSKFISKFTGLEPEGKLYVTSADFGGPISSVPIKQRDYCLILSWVFICACALYHFCHSSWWRWLVDATLSAWREAEAQHHHTE